MTAEGQATVAEQEYLETIFWLYEAGLPMTGANIARAMQLSAPTVHEMIGRLERDGYITRGTDRSLSFTDSGREHAEQIVRRHRMIERFLTDVLGIPWDEVHEEAERIEHAMSPVLEERMFAAIGDAKTCPHGHPINAGSRIQGVPLADCEPGRLDPDPALRERGRGAPALPPRSRGRAGVRGHVRGFGDDEVTIELGGKEIALTRSVAETVSVVADPSPPPRVALPEQLVHLQGPLRPLGQHALAAGEGEHAPRRPRRRDDLQRAPLRASPRDGAQQHPHARHVQEREPAEVDDHARQRPVQRAVDRRLRVVDHRIVELAGELDAGVALAAVDGHLHCFLHVATSDMEVECAAAPAKPRLRALLSRRVHAAAAQFCSRNSSSIGGTLGTDTASVMQPSPPTGDVRTAISDGLVALLKEFYGRGPERTRTYVSDDLVVCLMRGGFTRVEQTLIDEGQGSLVLRQRRAFEEIARPRFEQVVAEATGREVIGFMSGNQEDPDMLCQVFVLR